MAKKCVQCLKGFEVTQMEMELRAKCSPEFSGERYLFAEPEMCEQCRYQQRIAHRNEWSLYHRKCDLTGKQIVSIYSADKKFKVYDQEVWWSDQWDPRDYGREFDFNKSFFEQFAELQRDVPRLAIANTNSENSQYSNQASENKDCYIVVGSNQNEKCLYGNWFQKCQNCVDCYAIEKSEWCYECVNGSSLYHCVFVNHSENTSDAYFSSDLKGCWYVFGCHGLRNKEYYIFNDPVTKDEWEDRVGKLVLTPEVIELMKQRSEKVRLKSPHQYYEGKQNENFSGDLLQNCKSTYEAFNCRHCEDNILVQDVWESKDCVDMTETLRTELCFGLEGVADSYAVNFATKSWDIKYCHYIDLCFNSEYLFGCSGMSNQKYCIFNKQYVKEEYEELVPKIIEYMVKTGEWGSHFPAQYSPYGYNETIAWDYFPLGREEVLQKGWEWYDGESKSGYQGPEYNIPGNIREIGDDVCDRVLVCNVSGKPYRVVKQELEFYRTMGLPIPQKCFEQRKKERHGLRNPRILCDRECMQCGVEIRSSYSSDRAERIYCEQCYLGSL
jgi:hypothetical protein